MVLKSLLPSLLIASAFGCGRTHQARSVSTSGFLDDYSQLQEGKRKEALLTYTDPSVDFGKYHSIILEPIKAYPKEGDENFAEMPPEKVKVLLDYFEATVREQLSPNYNFVTEPGAGVMRFRIALTDADAGRVAMDVTSSIVPFGIAANILHTAAVGGGMGVGDASAEFEALDSVTGARLSAAVDKRIANKYTGRFDKFDKWRATKAACDAWAERLADRLEELRNPEQK
jgi:hypothetical protein